MATVATATAYYGMAIDPMFIRVDNGDERDSIKTIDRTHYPPCHSLNNRLWVVLRQGYRMQLRLRLKL
jgi:hypothetical protein